LLRIIGDLEAPQAFLTPNPAAKYPPGHQAPPRRPSQRDDRSTQRNQTAMNNGAEGGKHRREHRGPRRWQWSGYRLTAQAIALFGLWLALSGETAIEFLAIGALTAIAAVAFTEILFSGTHEGKFAQAPPNLSWLLASAVRFSAYVPWLVLEIAVSNVHVALLVLHPRLPIDPSLVEFDTALTSERAQVMLAQSITLTPGTVTVDASDGRFLIHCLSRKSRGGLAEGSIQTRIGRVFVEPTPGEVTLRDIIRPREVPL